jgi:hypothetical protein
MSWQRWMSMSVFTCCAGLISLMVTGPDIALGIAVAVAVPPAGCTPMVARNYEWPHACMRILSGITSEVQGYCWQSDLRERGRRRSGRGSEAHRHTHRRRTHLRSSVGITHHRRVHLLHAPHLRRPCLRRSAGPTVGIARTSTELLHSPHLRARL